VALEDLLHLVDLLGLAPNLTDSEIISLCQQIIETPRGTRSAREWCGIIESRKPLSPTNVSVRARKKPAGRERR